MKLSTGRLAAGSAVSSSSCCPTPPRLAESAVLDGCQTGHYEGRNHEALATACAKLPELSK